ncbi:hypothetical protein J1614_006170 [Plenodomus biglobosus]|nr:hypothetical protein J1614_006170 [Plenodomus biglobosus]
MIFSSHQAEYATLRSVSNNVCTPHSSDCERRSPITTILRLDIDKLNFIETADMMFNNHVFAAATLFSTLAIALPLDNRDVFPRNKSYDVVNVGGGSPAPATTVIRATKTVEVVNPGPTVEVTVPVPSPAAPACTSSTSESTTDSASVSAAPSSTSTTSMETPKPVYVTVTVPAEDGPYYDDGMWHTRYLVKTFDAVALATPLALASSWPTPPVLATPGLSYNTTKA